MGNARCPTVPRTLEHQEQFPKPFGIKLCVKVEADLYFFVSCDEEPPEEGWFTLAFLGGRLFKQTGLCWRGGATQGLKCLGFLEVSAEPSELCYLLTRKYNSAFGQ